MPQFNMQKNYIPIQEIYEKYNAIDTTKEPIVIIAKISLDQDEEKTSAIKERLWDSLLLYLHQYKFITKDFDIETKINHIEKLLKQNFTMPGAISSKKEAKNSANQIMAERHYKMFLNSELNKLKSQSLISSNGKPVEQPEFNTQIFTSYKGFQVFEALIKGFPKVNDDYAYIFRKLIIDKFIYPISQTVFKEYCNQEPFKIAIDKIKTLNVLENDKRLALYSSILNGIK